MGVTTGQQTVVRRLKERDEPLLEEMYEHAIPPGEVMGLPPYDEARRREWLHRLRTEGINLVALVGGVLAGHMVVLPDGERGEVVAFVRPEYRRQGIATALAQAALGEARSAGFQFLWVLIETTNVAARQGLLKFGFRPKWQTIQESQMVYPLREADAK
jgi:GNAT superfamily N-acetyltransferase